MFISMRKMQKKERKSKKLFKIVIWLCLLSSFLVVSCYYKPELYPITDILIPDESVKIIGFTDDGNTIVNAEFMLWVESLKNEIRRLRKLKEK